MKKETKKFIITLCTGLLTFIVFAFSFINVSLLWGGSWWIQKGFSGYGLIGSVNNFGGFLSDAFSILILIGAGLIAVISLFGILNALGKTKISLGKASLNIILKWTLFIMLCLTFLNMFWVLIDVGTCNGWLGNIKIYKYVVCFTSFLIFIIYAVIYCAYCLVEGKFMWIPNFWENFGKKKTRVKSNKLEEETNDENLENSSLMSNNLEEKE